MGSAVAIPPDCKYALLAVSNARVDALPPAGLVLADGAVALERMPVPVESNWDQWLGLKAGDARQANLVFLCTREQGFDAAALGILDDTNTRLKVQAERLFTMLRLLGTIEYESAFLLSGYFEGGAPTCREFGELPRYQITRGCLPWLIRQRDILRAARLADTCLAWLSRFQDARKVRLARGFWTLTDGLQEHFASERLHQFVRALEAFVYPPMGRTRRAFVHRCALFASAAARHADARKALAEAYDMRSDVEHLNDWDSSLGGHPADDRENLAYWRTRQMEALACATYVRLFGDEAPLCQTFSDDAALAEFWKKSDHDIKAELGLMCDITEIGVVQNYDQFGRAAYEEWPAGHRKSLMRTRAE